MYRLTIAMDSSHALAKYSGRVRAGAQPDGCVKDAVADVADHTDWGFLAFSEGGIYSRDRAIMGVVWV